MSSPSQKTTKKLSILSGNTCAFPKCPMPLVDKESGSVTAQICHIKAKNSGGPRYDPTQTNEERDAFENLILLCPVHHKVIDDDEESYTVERLQQIKKNHESRASASAEQGDLEKILENYLRSIIEKGNLNSASSETIKEENSSLMKAQKLAQKKMHDERRQKWLYSHDGLVDGINSVNEILSLIESRFSTNAETFSTLGIELNNKERLLRCIYNYNFGCKIELQGFRESDSNNKLANMRLQVFLFKKKPAHQDGLFYHKTITSFYLTPDLEIDGQVVWKDKENSSMILSAEGVCEELFDLLINQITENAPLDETEEGGRYLVDEEYVDAWGNPIEDDDYLDDDDMSSGW